MFCALVILLAGAAPGDTQPASRPALVARAEPAVELLSTVFRLAGNPEYNPPNAKSPYADDVDRHFGRLRDHAVIQCARRLRAQHGVSYDAVMSMAAHLELVEEQGTLKVRPRLPLEPRPPRLDERWTPAAIREFLAALQDFVAQSEFQRFWDEHRALYAAAGQRLTERLEQGRYLEWFDAFFGARPAARFDVRVGLLNGGNNYGVSVAFADGREEICPVIGAAEFDGDGRPVFGAHVEGTVVHELCHSYTNPIVDRHADRLEPVGQRLWKLSADTMRAQAYGDWKTMLYETLVRACTVRYHRATGGAQAARRAAAAEAARGFAWVSAVEESFEAYEADRARYPTLDAFMPQVVACLEAFAPQHEARRARAPRVVGMVPANGATDVDPGLTEMRITFDQPMQDGNWAIVRSDADFPEIVGTPAYDAERKVLTVQVRLKPDTKYRLWLNRGQFDSFRSAEGIPLESVAVTFQTRPG